MPETNYPTMPQVGIGIVVLRGEEVLLVRRGKPPGKGAWSLPGGRQELGETAEACARRELLEETGIIVGPLTLIAHVDSIHRNRTGRIEFHYTILDFGGLYESGAAVPGDDVSELAWVRPEDFDAYKLWQVARDVIARAFTQLQAK
ncbi:MAG TPA: NUDIX hydrolase [Acidocella sp.]|jgi:8-oxo-dGTP diphosphatase|uniref:NUDIX hydrolase n=1 Tax=Acidocella sp. TaxID=50710 RepID=UPI002C1D17A3|nr:NUDIX hydrolase [Acidocella sp.]HVE20873.1 NUDIX hydrolase [Acidocella sp.]